jgi:hypothetical protein
MSRNELNAILAGVLTTAAECQPCPESMVYLGLGCDMWKWNVVREVLISCKLAMIRDHAITLTKFGREMAAKCNQALVQKATTNG